MTVPLAVRLPQILDGLAPPILLRTIELTEGCRNEVVSPFKMLKLLQLRMAEELTVTLSCDPIVCVVAEPETTVRPDGLARSSPTGAMQHSSSAQKATESFFCWKIMRIRIGS